ncbi:NADPH-dependent FMN reductase [Pusillimonas sp.]|uniref:NADPH-dependent FMN reductase n=1 Tax=Pusillimonas sp. TaxID=3040095 RepID=UPI0037CC8077
MKAYRVAILVGSLRRDSYNRQLAEALIAAGSGRFEFQRVRIDDLPLYNQDHDENQAEPVRRMKRQVREADGVIFVTPEYNRSIPGVLKNAIDHGSRPFDDSVWAGKPAGVMGASPGSMATALSQRDLRNVLASLDMPTLAQPEAYVLVKEGTFNNIGGVNEESVHVFMQDWLHRYAAWVARFA